MAIHFEVRETFRAPPERVFDALTDLEKADRWMPGLVRLEPLAPGEMRVGSGWRETRKMFGKEATEEFEVTAHEPPRRLELRVDGTKGSTGSGEYLFTYHLEPRDGGTELRLVGDVQGLSGIMGLMGKLFTGMYRKSCAKDLMALKAHLEEGEG